MHARARKVRRGWRRRGILWDYNGDGRYPSEQVKGFWKRYWRRWKKRLLPAQEDHEEA
jgi:hypothetical protein